MQSHKQQEYRAFTTYSNGGLLRSIINDAHVSIPLFSPEYPPEPEDLIAIKVLWDTGATGSVITSETVKKLDLKPISKANVIHAGGESVQNIYLVHIYLPNKVMIPFVRVTETPSTLGDFDGIIGMNIITLGDFDITNVNNITVCSFRIPSIETIDYVKEIEKSKNQKMNKSRKKKR